MIKYHLRFLILILLAGWGCADIENDSPQQNVGDASGVVKDDASITLEGGRERFVCIWKGLPGDVLAIVLSHPQAGQFEIPAEAVKGESESMAVPEGEWTMSVSYKTVSGVREGGRTVPLKVWGQIYEASLPTHTLTRAVYSGARAEITIKGDFATGQLGYEFLYTSSTGQQKSAFMEAKLTAEQTMTIEDVGSEVSYRTVWCPGTHLKDRFCSSLVSVPGFGSDTPVVYNETVDGYRGAWYDLGQASDYGSKYSGGLGTYTMKHIPMAVYAPAVDRTYFVYGGNPAKGNLYLQCMIGCYDHATGLLQKPRVVMDKGAIGVSDPHDNPTVQIDADGYVWVFVAGRANHRLGKRYRSIRPYDITAFDLVSEEVMAYPQVFYQRDNGFFLFFTRYDDHGRQLFFQSSADGRTWTSRRHLATIVGSGETKGGQYQISNMCGIKLCTAFNRHINANVDTRTNIYFLQSTDWGNTWTTVDGNPVSLPVTDPASISRVRDYESLGLNCYIKDVNFDSHGNPVILYLTSSGHKTGPEGGTRKWHTLHWTGTGWVESVVTTSTHNYDSGSLWIDRHGWRIIAPTAAGPQYWGTGGEVVMWESTDEGVSWHQRKMLTSNSVSNHSYVRRPQAAADGFYAFWADGNPDMTSASCLYFCDSEGNVFRMPYNQISEWETPEKIL